jgi:2,4-dienoyl-CoA reductase-like NADH-dependent reductase (Old Yellow Enzyme family)
VLCSGRADIISIARVLVADPDILQRTARGAKLRIRGLERLPSERQPPKA